jgi:hypothetical protein
MQEIRSNVCAFVYQIKHYLSVPFHVGVFDDPVPSSEVMAVAAANATYQEALATFAAAAAVVEPVAVVDVYVNSHVNESEVYRRLRGNLDDSDSDSDFESDDDNVVVPIVENTTPEPAVEDVVVPAVEDVVVPIVENTTPEPAVEGVVVPIVENTTPEPIVEDVVVPAMEDVVVPIVEDVVVPIVEDVVVPIVEDVIVPTVEDTTPGPSVEDVVLPTVEDTTPGPSMEDVVLPTVDLQDAVGGAVDFEYTNMDTDSSPKKCTRKRLFEESELEEIDTDSGPNKCTRKRLFEESEIEKIDMRTERGPDVAYLQRTIGTVIKHYLAERSAFFATGKVVVREVGLSEENFEVIRITGHRVHYSPDGRMAVTLSVLYLEDKVGVVSQQDMSLFIHLTHVWDDYIKWIYKGCLKNSRSGKRTKKNMIGARGSNGTDIIVQTGRHHYQCQDFRNTCIKNAVANLYSTFSIPLLSTDSLPNSITEFHTWQGQTNNPFCLKGGNLLKVPNSMPGTVRWHPALMAQKIYFWTASVLDGDGHAVIIDMRERNRHLLLDSSLPGPVKFENDALYWLEAWTGVWEVGTRKSWRQVMPKSLIVDE